MAGCDNWMDILDETFHIARKTLKMAAPSPKTKHVVRQGSPHPKDVRYYADKGEVPATCLTPKSARARDAVEEAARAGTLKGTASEIEACGFRGRNVKEYDQEQEFTDRHISPYRLPPPKIEHDQLPPPLKTMRKPTVGLITHKERRPVYIKKKTTRVTFPSSEPVKGQNVLQEQGQILDKESPDKKPWDWACEEKYPGSNKTKKMVKELKYKLEKVKRKLQEVERGAVMSREPRLGAEKRFGDLDFQYVTPAHRYTSQCKKRADEEHQLKAARKDWSGRHKRQLFTSGSSSDIPGRVCPIPEGPGEVYGTPSSSSMGGSYTTCPTGVDRSPPSLAEAADFVNYAEETLRNMCSSPSPGEPKHHSKCKSPEPKHHSPCKSPEPKHHSQCKSPEPSTWV